MKIYALMIALIALSGCALAVAPQPSSQEPGFTAFCTANPHYGPCP